MSDKQKQDVWYYVCQRKLDVENIAVSNQIPRAEFEPGDIIRAKMKLPSWLTESRSGRPGFLKLLENGSEASTEVYDVELPRSLLRARY